MFNTALHVTVDLSTSHLSETLDMYGNPYTPKYPHEPGSKLLVLGMVIQPFNRNPYNGYINPYCWVDDHPLLYGNNGSLDPSTHGTQKNKKQHPQT